ncbi:MoxR family ATPase [Acinetobacter baumannii]
MSNDKITCEICGAQVHAIEVHLNKKECREPLTIAQYREKFPEAPLMSDTFKALYEKRKAKQAAEAAEAKKKAEELAAKEAEEKPKTENSTVSVASVLAMSEKDKVVTKALHEVFDLKGKDAKNSKGGAIPVSCIENATHQELVPTPNETYVYDTDDLKNVLLALELGINPYVWGHKGTGKSELFEQIAARTGRPFMRIQHTANTEESHIVGMWTVKDGQTVFELGPLALAMKHGWMYLADEYDFALPSVLSVYQAVLEGKPLMIKEADAENRVIKPHPNFRFVATGNTNGSGDETGLYQGTNLQNSANYDRFGMVLEKKYMNKKAESEILQKRCGLVEADADKLVGFATLVREAYDGAKISDTISPRTLINAANIGIRRGSFKIGVQLSFANKLSRVDKEVVESLAQRVFG